MAPRDPPRAALRLVEQGVLRFQAIRLHRVQAGLERSMERFLFQHPGMQRRGVLCRGMLLDPLDARKSQRLGPTEQHDIVEQVLLRIRRGGPKDRGGQDEE